MYVYVYTYTHIYIYIVRWQDDHKAAPQLPEYLGKGGKSPTHGPGSAGKGRDPPIIDIDLLPAPALVPASSSPYSLALRSPQNWQTPSSSSGDNLIPVLLNMVMAHNAEQAALQRDLFMEVFQARWGTAPASDTNQRRRPARRGSCIMKDMYIYM